MAARVRRRESALAFEALSIEGGLLAPEWLARVAQLQAGQQSEGDYRVPKGLTLRDEIGRYWRVAQANWKEFAAGREQAGDPIRARALSERFVRGLLTDAFGFASLQATPPVAIDGRTYPIGFAALGGRVPVVVGPAGASVDSASPAYGEAGRRRSPFGLVQEFLNAAPGSTWGLVSDGCVLRIARDNASLTRPAWIEANLARIFNEERYADFAALWLLTHESRFGPASPAGDASRPAECALETWREASREEGTRARDALRDGFEDALLALGQGFLSHPRNTVLREALQDGSLTKDAYYQQLLRLVYRLIFLLTVEERGLLHPPGVPQRAIDLYRDGYSLRRLRNRAVKRSAHDRFSDLWDSLKIVFRALADGEERLGLPALAGLFAKTQCEVLDASELHNRFLLQAIFRLSWLREMAGLVRVNWRDMGPEELGSVYESLLELVPQTAADGRQFTFAVGAETKGNARKTTGSYYTPDSLVQVLLDRALEPVIADTLSSNPDRPIDALLGLSIVDPACGSGHFLLAAARRLAGHVARLQAAGTPSAAEYRHALRQVIGRCIYGVDQNPMAVELCQVSLWMEAVEPGLPLSFLDSHIQCGNSLLGTTQALMTQGVPDVAWEPIEGDDKKIANSLKKRNKLEGLGFQTLPFADSPSAEQESRAVARAVAGLEAASDADAHALAVKTATWKGILESEEYRRQKFVADAWCAAFVWPKHTGTIADVAPTHERWLRIRSGEDQPSALTKSTVEQIAVEYGFFHWQLQFPRVFARGGFDIVLGNPPWEKVKLQEREYFAEIRPDIAAASTAAERARLIADLQAEFPDVWLAFRRAKRAAEGETALVARSGRYPHSAVGDTNTYPLFVELAMAIGHKSGRVGQIVKTGILADFSLRGLFAHLVETRRLESGYDFSNRNAIFPAVVANERFTLLVLRGEAAPAEHVEIAVLCDDVTALSEPGRIWQLSATDIALINPNTHTCPLFQSSADAEIVGNIYRRLPVLLDEGSSADGNAWGVSYYTMFHMTNDSGAFCDLESLVESMETRPASCWNGRGKTMSAVLEGKLFDQFDHRHGTFLGVPRSARFGIKAEPNHPDTTQKNDPAYDCLPRYWIDDSLVETEFRQRLADRPAAVLAFRDVCRTHTDLRTVRAAINPPCGAGNKAPLLIFPDCDSEEHARRSALLCAVLNSIILDYVARQKFAGGSLNKYILLQFPVPSPETFRQVCSWSAETIGRFVLDRVLELTYTAWNLQNFARALGFAGPPFHWNPARRFLLRCELDSAFLHIYGVTRVEAEYVIGTFPILRRSDESAYGEFRTKRVVLEMYDQMAIADRSGRFYVSRLDPPPADPKVTHPDTRPAGRLGDRAE